MQAPAGRRKPLLAPCESHSRARPSARRYAELQDEACAVVISQNGKVLRCYRHKEFPYVSVKLGDPVPALSIAVSDRLRLGEPSDWNEIDRAIWSNTRNPGLMLEQTLSSGTDSG